MAAARERWRTEGLDVPDGLLPNGSDDALPIHFPPPIPSDVRVPEDSVVHMGAPPTTPLIAPPVESTLASGGLSGGDLEPAAAFAGLDLRATRSDVGVRQRSASLAGSILIHLGLVLLIAMLVAPANLGRQATQTLTMTLTEEETVAPVPVLMVDQQPDEQAAEASESTLPTEDQPVDVPFIMARPKISIGGARSAAGESRSRGGGGIRGSFFGIEAKGHEFAYVVDRSGSMNGNRYRRAIDELKRSVRELKPHQKFLVVLFSDKTKLMFNQEGGSAEMVPATDANKDRLDEWLSTIGASGGTHPNASLRIALRMKPSAVFMLSDGEFSNAPEKKRGSMFEAGGDAYSIVAATGNSIPIHSIAFEDPRSCANMKRLATMTGGEYRFVNWAGKTQNELLAEAQKLIEKPFNEQRRLEQTALCKQFGAAPVSDNAKRVFALMLHKELSDRSAAEDRVPEDRMAHRNGNSAASDDSHASAVPISELLQLAQSLSQIDPLHGVCADLQDRVAGDLSRGLGELTETATVMKHLDAVARWPKSTANEKLLDRLSDHFARLADRPATESFARLQTMQALHPDSSATEVCREICDNASRTILQESERHLEAGDLVAAIRTLRGSRDEQRHPLLDSRIRERLREVTVAKLAEARDATQKRQDDVKSAIHEELERGFGDDPILKTWKREFVSKELAARRLLQRTEADRHRKSNAVTERRLKTIVRQYPLTLASRQAEQELRSMASVTLPTDQEEAELIRMMDSGRRR